MHNRPVAQQEAAPRFDPVLVTRMCQCMAGGDERLQGLVVRGVHLTLRPQPPLFWGVH